MKTIICIVVLAIIGHASALPVGLSPITTSGTIIRSDLGLPSLIRSDLGISTGLPLATIPASTINLASGLPAAVSIRSAAAAPIALSGLSPITLSARAPIGSILPLTAGSPIISTNSGILRTVPLGGSVISHGSINLAPATQIW
ncbi:adult cuticle protein 1-like [Toxorhynchites rutilus septentrionalis]|uniref:adult cuticle protein 1-like n=1 Tax=Toxorhynchites rutilus septentrionalis TaxID=329112 RepID=UPI00247B152F|nr:adult cuticle protein 1-like [Toxorhynchites rutilus septentrionalis]